MTGSGVDTNLVALHISDSDSGDHFQLAAEMVSRCSVLLAELEDFQSYLKEKKKENNVDLKGFKRDIETDLKRIKALPLGDATKCNLTLSCTNIPFLEAVWSAAKRSTGIKSVLSIGKRTLHQVPEKSHGYCISRKTGPEKLVSTVDIVARNDSEWVKVSTITERRMLFDLAKSGWVDGDTSDEDADYDSDGLLRVAMNLVKVARSARVKYRCPRVR
jgi:hypothetical protein